MRRSSFVEPTGPGTVTLCSDRGRVRPHRVLERRLATRDGDSMGLEAQRGGQHPKLRRHQGTQLHQRTVAPETRAHRHHGAAQPASRSGIRPMTRARAL